MWEIWVVCPCKWRVCKINLLLQFCDFDLVWKRYFPTYHLRLCWSITMHSVHRILEKPIHIHFLNCLYLFRLLSFQIFVLRLNGNGPLNRARHKHISKFSTFWNSKKEKKYVISEPKISAPNWMINISMKLTSPAQVYEMV